MIVAKRSFECMQCHRNPVFNCQEYCSILDKYRIGWSFKEIQNYYKLSDTEFKKAWATACESDDTLERTL